MGGGVAKTLHLLLVQPLCQTLEPIVARESKTVDAPAVTGQSVIQQQGGHFSSPLDWIIGTVK